MKHTPDKFCDNAYLCALDMSHATDEQQIAWLNLIIDNELARGDQKDEQLIYECAEHLELLAPAVSMTAEECRAKLQTLLNTVETDGPKQARILPCPPISHDHRKFRFRIAALASAFLLLIALSPQVYAHTVQQRDYRLSADAIRHEITLLEQEYLSLAAPYAVNREPYQATYESLEELFRNHEDLSFYYPTQLPANQGIRSIRITYLAQDSWIVIFTFWDPSVKYYTARRLPASPEGAPTAPYESVDTIDGRTYTTTTAELDGKNALRTVCIHDKILYTLMTDDLDTTREILSHTKSRAYRYEDMAALLSDWAHLPDLAWQEQLPSGFSISGATLTYDTQASWQIVVRLSYHDGTRTMSNHSLTLTPATDHDFGNDTPRLSNEKTDIYISYASQSEVAGLCQAECTVGKIKYNTKIFGYEPFMAFLNGFFGPF
ncbi:MAG: hypothetical protein IJW99_10425 [Clostridia bacterium]|nr:hypothetical protein [Clostridia bacterium]